MSFRNYHKQMPKPTNSAMLNDDEDYKYFVKGIDTCKKKQKKPQEVQKNVQEFFFGQNANPYALKSEVKPKNYDLKMWQELGKKICTMTKGLLPPGESLAEMDAMELSGYLLAAHVKEHELDPDEGCVLLTEEVRRILYSKHPNKLNLNFQKAMPRIAAPMACELPPPPAKWLTTPKNDPYGWLPKQRSSK